MLTNDMETAPLPDLVTETMRGMGEQLCAVEAELARMKAVDEDRSKRLSLLVFSGSFDRLVGAFTIALAASAMGIQVTMFFAFWGVTALRTRRRFLGKGIWECLISAMLPAGPRKVSPSQWGCGGIGRLLFRHLMRRHKMMQLEEMVSSARELGVRFVCCETTAELMGIREDELLHGARPGGVATYLDLAYQGRLALIL